MTKPYKYYVMLDAGHGGEDTGAIHNGLTEKDLNLLIAEGVNRALSKRKNVCVLMTRADDRFIKLLERTENTAGIDCFVSIHFNAFSTGEPHGIETFVHTQATGDSVGLGSYIHAQLIDYTGARDRGLKTADFMVLRDAQCPACLLELGFLSNPHEAFKIGYKDYQGKLIDGIAAGIVDYLLNKDDNR
jgi:N-acetylmuramoyl-L-alanine amidase